MTAPHTPHDQHVLGGQRAMDEAADQSEPDTEPRWTWHHLPFLFAISLLLGVVVYHAGSTQ